MRFAVLNSRTTIKPAGRRPFAGCVAASILAGLLIAGCSSSSDNSTTMAENNIPATGAAASEPQVHQALANSCFDCHSDRGASTWNGMLAPSYLFGAGSARRTLNFSEWQTYDAQERKAEREAVATAVADGSMPPGDYDFLHPSARLTGEQKQLVLQWASGAKPAH